MKWQGRVWLGEGGEEQRIMAREEAHGSHHPHPHLRHLPDNKRSGGLPPNAGVNIIQVGSPDSSNLQALKSPECGRKQ
ncbi:hypothetical protein ElyMa_004242500 [Elysia marginata]|uniref:Uncharacterized protein n=1 Tax=Elysia marginata TaxID=1093978 RepID=A0AAV4GS09_9GAST|nr:hypothetical protein ElyMa_004242500 [Elysia marginata]